MKSSTSRLSPRRIRSLQLEYKDKPQPDLLVAIPNSSPDVVYDIKISTNEFTSLCPLNQGQPDYANVLIQYFPGKLCVELKSLKMYLASFRQVAVFHEMVPAKNKQG